MTSRVAMICGVLGALWLLAMVLIGGATYPGYDHTSQFISELGATGAPYGEAVSYFGFFPAGVLISAFALFAYLAAPRSLLSAIGFFCIFLFALGYLGATVFHCDYGCRPEEPSSSQVMHNLLGGIGYLLAPVFMVLLGIASRKWPNAGLVSSWAFVSGVVSLAGLLTIAPESPYVGVSQRLIEASVLSWVVVCALYLGRQHLGRQPRER